MLPVTTGHHTALLAFVDAPGDRQRPEIVFPQQLKLPLVLGEPFVGKFVGKEALAAVGGVCALRKKGGAALLMIPVTVLGGALYHLIFEAKAQYAYPYMVYMLPLAAAGLCRLEDGAARLICSGKKWVQRRAECARTSHRD